MDHNIYNLNDYISNDHLSIIVKPNSKKNEIIGYDQNKKALRVSIKASPENNEANIEIIKFFSKLSGKKVKIIYGLKNKNKILKFE
ncbi:MAG: DUF167 domain-containing protein [Candidatus Woesearchaeota archaeon]